MTDNTNLPPASTLDCAVVAFLGSLMEDHSAEDINAAFASVGYLRARQAPAPVEVSRLAQEAKALATEVQSHKRARDVYALWDMIDRLASMASTPASEVPAGWIGIKDRLPEPYADVLIKRADGTQRAARLNRAGAWELATYKDANRHQYMATDVVAWFDATPASSASEVPAPDSTRLDALDCPGWVIEIRCVPQQFGTGFESMVKNRYTVTAGPINGKPADTLREAIDLALDLDHERPVPKVAATPASPATEGASSTCKWCCGTGRFSDHACRFCSTQWVLDNRAAPIESEAQKAVAWQARCKMHPKWRELPESQVAEYLESGWEVRALGVIPTSSASTEVQGLPEPDWLAVDTPGADFDVSFALTMEEALQLNDGDPDAPTYVTKLYSEEKVRALAAKNGWRLGGEA